MRARRPLPSRDQVSSAKISPLAFSSAIRPWAPTRKTSKAIQETYKPYKPYKPTKGSPQIEKTQITKKKVYSLKSRKYNKPISEIQKAGTRTTATGNRTY